MKLDMYQVDAFARGPFSGNPAAVVPLEEWLPDELLQNIALENNLSETAFFTKSVNGYHLRWFTPNVEVRLCGHATLASAHVIFSHLGYEQEEISFDSKSGLLSVSKNEKGYSLNFPSDIVNPIEPIEAMSKALGATPTEWYRGKDDYLLVYDQDKTIKQMKPDFNSLMQFDTRGILVTAASSGEFDFISRGFFPLTGINEDPATGSAHTALCPYWSKKLSKKKLSACQWSDRKGYLECTDLGLRTKISGKCIDYLIGEISV